MMSNLRQTPRMALTADLPRQRQHDLETAKYRTFPRREGRIFSNFAEERATREYVDLRIWDGTLERTHHRPVGGPREYRRMIG